MITRNLEEAPPPLDEEAASVIVPDLAGDMLIEDGYISQKDPLLKQGRNAPPLGANKGGHGLFNHTFR
jgi:hypothetical protein